MKMQRRRFQQVALASLSLPAATRPQAQTTGHRELRIPAPVDAPSTSIEVVDFFWYGCPHCNAFGPLLEPWVERQPADVVIRRSPVLFQPSFGVHQRLYFTLEAMGQIASLHRRVFSAIHIQRRRLDTESSILGWAREQSELDADRFAQLFSSFGIAGKASRATQLQQAYGVSGVPALGVAGRYYVDGALAGDMVRALSEVDRLIATVRRTRRG